MNVEDFTYDLPPELIADRPAAVRDESRLLVVRGGAPGAPLEHRRFRDIGGYLRPGDLLVMNDSRVLPARLYGRRSTGGRVEFLLLHREADHPPTWRALARPARKLTRGEVIEIAPGELSARILEDLPDGEKRVEFACEGDFRALLEKHGLMPLPPYILKRREAAGGGVAPDPAVDRERYQTVYARAEGSVAAPTAGLHFTRELLGALRDQGVQEAWVTLHVGAGTFQSMKEGGRVEEHRMHFEECEVGEETAALVNRAKEEGRRVIAVGTTSVRTLESAWDPRTRRVVPGRRSTDLMIAPGYRFGVVDALVTNFHLPRSTLLLLVSALVGRERILAAYAEAVRERYRFFSYGDAMLLLP